ncbi:MAG: hypothetical protein AB9879_06120 [Methanothrix sp.]
MADGRIADAIRKKPSCPGKISAISGDVKPAGPSLNMDPPKDVNDIKNNRPGPLCRHCLAE